jgi:hypothetical protein
MVEAMSHRAMEVSPARATRDSRALVWTVKSLADDTELEPFIEAIPDVLWGPSHRRYAYEGHIQKLMRNPDLQLLPHIAGLLRSCRTGLLSEEGNRRRRITCYKALWAIANIQTVPEAPSDLLPLDFSQLADHWDDHLEEKETSHYSTSAVALMKWSAFCSIKGHILTFAKSLEADVQRGRTSNLQHVKPYSDAMSLFNFPISMKLWQYLYELSPSNLVDVVADIVEAVESFCSSIPHKILFNYLVHSATLEAPPYRYTKTQATIPFEFLASSSALEHDLEQALADVVSSISADRRVDDTIEWFDVVIRQLCSFWQPLEPRPIPLALIRYLNQRKSESAIEELLLFPFQFTDRVLQAFPIMLLDTPSQAGCIEGMLENDRDEVLAALWRVASLTIHPTHFQPILDAVANLPSSPLTSSVIALCKIVIVNNLEYSAFSNPLGHPLLPTETAIAFPDELPDADPLSEARRYN